MMSLSRYGTRIHTKQSWYGLTKGATIPISNSPPPVEPRTLDPAKLQLEKPKTFRWTNDPDNTYIRTGGCTDGCGACCESLFLPLKEGIEKSEGFEDYTKWLKLHGVILFRSNGELQAHIPIQCEALTDDKRCGVYGTDERPDMCHDYPQHPAELTGLEDICTYQLHKVPTKMLNKAVGHGD